MLITPPQVLKYAKDKGWDEDQTRMVLQGAYELTRLNLWDWFYQYKPPENAGYLYAIDETLQRLTNALDQYGHSGASLAILLRILRAMVDEIALTK